MTSQLLRDHRNAKRRCFEKRPFSMALRMYDNGKWEKTPEGKKAIKTALFAIELCNYKEGFNKAWQADNM